MLPSSAQYGALLALVRIYTGIFWILHGMGKIRDPHWAAPGGTCAGIIQQMLSAGSGSYHDFVVNTVLPNVTIFANLVAFGETLTGISLLLGLLSRLGGLGGVFLALNYWSAKGDFAHASGYAGFDFATAVLSFISLTLPTGRVLGIDGILSARKRAANTRREPTAPGVSPPNST